MKAMLQTDRGKLFVLLLCTDLLFITVHIAAQLLNLDDPLLSIEHERGIGELLQHIKQFWIVLLLLVMVYRQPRLIWGVLLLVFTYILLDDTLQVHERGGRWLNQQIQLPELLGLRAQDLGELLVTGVVVGVLLLLLTAAYWWAEAGLRPTITRLLFLLVLLFGFGVGVDMLHSLLDGQTVRRIAGVIEDGGEMLVTSVITAYVFALVNLPAAPRSSETVPLPLASA